MIPAKLTEKVRILLSQETGTIRKPHGERLSFALAFPNTYWVGMSSLGFQLVYAMLNAIPDVVCERVFLPEPDEETLLRRARSRLFTLESQTPVSEFDALAFSIYFEMDYLNVLKTLSLSGLPLLASERDESHPLALAGGPCATFNPEPLAEFVDAFVIGEAEDAIPEIVDILRSAGGAPRMKLLERLANVAGVYVPRFYTPTYRGDGSVEGIEVAQGIPARVTRRRTADLGSHKGTSAILTPNTEFAEMRLTEVIRGCGRQCRFCAAGYTSLPPRPRKVELSDDASRVGLVGSAVFDHPGAQAICEEMVGQGRGFSVSSIRLETLTRELAELMRRGGQETITLAPEAGTERLRRVINKATTDAQIMDAVEIACSAGFKRVKLYFMVGLPTETEDDVAATGALAGRIAAKFTSLNIQLSVSCYVPKPWTPFQWAPMATERELSAKINRLKAVVVGNRQVKMSAESPRMSVVQGWLARGDRRLALALARALESGSYARGIEQSGLDPSFYTRRERGLDEVFPWDHIDLGVKKEYLRREYQRAFEGATTPPCDPPRCRRCGVC